jgi:hypothetical protein
MKRAVALELLGLREEHPTKDQINKAYRSAIRVVHPDKYINDGKLRQHAEEQFMLLGEARNYLLHSEKDERYHNSKIRENGASRGESSRPSPEPEFACKAQLQDQQKYCHICGAKNDWDNDCPAPALTDIWVDEVPLSSRAQNQQKPALVQNKQTHRHNYDNDNLVFWSDAGSQPPPAAARISKAPSSADTVRSAWEESIVRFIRATYPALSIETNNRTVIPSRKFSDTYLEIDIWIPRLRLGIEANGVAWHDKAAYDNDRLHGTNHSDEMYKEKYCRSKGIVLLHVWDTESLNEICNRIVSAVETQRRTPNLVPYVATTEDEKWEKLAIPGVVSAIFFITIVINYLYAIQADLFSVVVSYPITFAICYLGYSIYLKIKTKKAEGAVKSKTLRIAGYWLIAASSIALFSIFILRFGSSLELRIPVGIISSIIFFIGAMIVDSNN